MPLNTAKRLFDDAYIEQMKLPFQAESQRVGHIEGLLNGKYLELIWNAMRAIVIDETKYFDPHQHNDMPML